jgi:opacity protein-like surface antigen
MKRPIFGAVAAAVLYAGLGLASTAQAQMNTQRANYREFFFGVGVGLVMPTDMHLSATGTVVGSGDASFDNGVVGTVGLGFNFNPWLALEVEGGYASVGMDKIDGTLSSGGTTISGSMDVDGDVRTWLGMVNLFVRPMGMGRISPYVGGGAGVAHSKTEIRSVSSGGSIIAVNGSSEQTDFAAQGIAGLDVGVLPNFSIGARYRFFWVDSGRSETQAGTTTTTDDATAHAFEARGTFHF